MVGRRSSNRNTPRKKYTVDAFEGIEELRDASGDDEPQSSRNDDDSADEFHAGGAQDSGDDAMSGAEAGANENELDGASDAGEDLLDDDLSIAEDPDRTARRSKAASKLGRGARHREPQLEEVHTRGLPQSLHGRSFNGRKMHWFGPTRADYRTFEAANAKWELYPTLPTRKVDRLGHGGFSRSVVKSHEQLDAEDSAAWKWFLHDGGKEAFSRGQVAQSLTSDEAKEYVSPELTNERQFVMGPYEKQRMFNLAVGQSVPLQDAWQHKADDKHSSSPKSGFILNLGARARCLDWQSSQNGKCQLLAASVHPDRESELGSFNAPSGPAFSPQPPYKASIQIWQFIANDENSIDSQSAPKLSLVLCTAWGDIKSLKWCPTSPKDSVGPALLAGIWGDGKIRILQVPQIAASTTAAHPHYLSISRAAFSSRPPSTICTSLDWINPFTIAAGCANGCVAIWHLPTVLQAPVTNLSTNPRPRTYASISTSYITSIATCSPSRPDMLMTASMAGHLTLTSLTSPQPASHASTAFSQRARTGASHFMYCDHVSAALTVDDNFTLRAHPLRRLFNTVGIGRVQGIASAMAGSPCHPYVLIGTVAGEVVGLNPIPKVLARKVDRWQQVLFAHEWRRPNAGEALQTSGLSRFVEGFKPDQVNLNVDEGNLNNQRGGVLFATVHEEKTAVTALAWNPNLHVAGWMAAGMADGLVRVEDVAV